MQIRKFQWDDMPLIVDVMNRYSQALGSTNRVTQADLEPRWRAPHNHPDRDCFIAILPDKGCVGFTIADLLDTPNQSNGVYFVLPGHPQAADALIKATEDHFLQMAQAAGVTREITMTYNLSDKSTEGIAVLESRSYVQPRQFYTMQASLSEPIAPVDSPEGITLRVFNPSDAQAAYTMEVEAFRDHWNYYIPPFEEWIFDVQKPDFDPQHWWLALAGDEIIGLVLSESHSADIAWISIVAVRSDWRRKGVALALLNRCFAVHQAQGRQWIRLGVDTDNRYNALAVYERAGMSVYNRTLYYQKQFSTT